MRTRWFGYRLVINCSRLNLARSAVLVIIALYISFDARLTACWMIYSGLLS